MREVLLRALRSILARTYPQAAPGFLCGDESRTGQSRACGKLGRYLYPIPRPDLDFLNVGIVSLQKRNAPAQPLNHIQL
jgi:hypothetical protein